MGLAVTLYLHAGPSRVCLPDCGNHMQSAQNNAERWSFRTLTLISILYCIIVYDINWAKVEYSALENKGHRAKEFEQWRSQTFNNREKMLGDYSFGIKSTVRCWIFYQVCLQNSERTLQKRNRPFEVIC